MWVGHDGHALQTRTSIPTLREWMFLVAHELGRKFTSLQVDDQATLKRNIRLNQLRLIQIGGFNVIRAMDVCLIGWMECWPLMWTQEHVWWLESFSRSNLELVFARMWTTIMTIWFWIIITITIIIIIIIATTIITTTIITIIIMVNNIVNGLLMYTMIREIAMPSAFKLPTSPFSIDKILGISAADHAKRRTLAVRHEAVTCRANLVSVVLDNRLDWTAPIVL